MDCLAVKSKNYIRKCIKSINKSDWHFLILPIGLRSYNILIEIVLVMLVVFYTACLKMLCIAGDSFQSKWCKEKITELTNIPR